MEDGLDRRPRFTLRGLLAFTGFVAVGCASLTYASPMWACIVFTATLGILLAAVLRAIFRRGAVRAFWAGFAIVGWFYVWAVHTPTFSDLLHEDNTEEWRMQLYGPLVTTGVLNMLYFGELEKVRPFPPKEKAPEEIGPYDLWLTWPDQISFMRVGHSLWTILLGCLGGLFARRCYAAQSAGD